MTGMEKVPVRVFLYIVIFSRYLSIKRVTIHLDILNYIIDSLLFYMNSTVSSLLQVIYL